MKEDIFFLAFVKQVLGKNEKKNAKGKVLRAPLYNFTLWCRLQSTQLHILFYPS